jgi:hypothetical protein
MLFTCDLTLKTNEKEERQAYVPCHIPVHPMHVSLVGSCLDYIKPKISAISTCFHTKVESNAAYFFTICYHLHKLQQERAD